MGLSGKFGHEYEATTKLDFSSWGNNKESEFFLPVDGRVCFLFFFFFKG